MTYRDRRARRAERLRGWAEKREQKSAAAFTRARTIADAIPFGQPILVGHHSEKHHRRDLARIDSGMRAGIEHQQKAASMDGRAAEIERQADASIYDDDPDAIARLRERIADLETRRDRIKTANAAIRRHGLQRLIQPDPPFTLTDAEKRELLQLMELCPYHQAEKRGFPAYVLQNLAGNLTRQRQRLARLTATDAARKTARPRCRCCGEWFTPSESDAADPDIYCSAACERGELAAPIEPESTYAETMQPDDAAATLTAIAATLNQDPPPLAEPPPFTLTPPAAGPDAHQPSFLTPPADREPPCRR